ncbi:MAG: Lrp/AsnC family transcriptional regulator [Deltaproteobacteria bacterium]|jgi:Lrp/AsnC family leucine-responsive transcriptional regulator|nr:Lrp/AsnC family transcriptional regulator [Deltaproteobacteria bacterium]MCW8892153.1 Lrp/AsnC family transcriptional regulator [Deltaproteobacteria bacterium]MCW9050048.1 Lrp/AsnC family transcriptional regulator [Deltaproteobacteria bacterium]
MDIKRTIDEIDYKILVILQEKARIPNAEVARQVGMAPSAVLERIRKLEDHGIIEGYEVRLNPQPFNQGLMAFVQVSIQQACHVDLAHQLAEVTGVQDVHQVAGDDGYLLKLRVADNAELGKILADEICALDGVLQTKTSIVLNTTKETRKIDLNRLTE